MGRRPRRSRRGAAASSSGRSKVYSGNILVIAGLILVFCWSFIGSLLVCFAVFLDNVVAIVVWYWSFRVLPWHADRPEVILLLVLSFDFGLIWAPVKRRNTRFQKKALRIDRSAYPRVCVRSGWVCAASTP